MLSHPMPVCGLSRGPFGLINSDTLSYSAIARQHCVHMSTSSCLKEWFPEDPVYSDWTHEPRFSDRDTACPTSLRLRLHTVTQYGHGWDVVIALSHQALDDLEWLSNPTPPDRCYHLDRRFHERLGGSLSGNIYWSSLECRGDECAHQCLGITGCIVSLESTTTTSATCTQCPHTDRQHYSSGIHQQEWGDALPCPDESGLGTVGSCPGSGSVLDSTAYSRDSEWSSRLSLPAAREQNRVDPGQRDISVYLSEILHTRSGPLCVSPDPIKCPGTSRGTRTRGLWQWMCFFRIGANGVV